jgi:hypothetical protein
MRRSRNKLLITSLAIFGSVAFASAHFPPGELLFAVQFPDANIPVVDGNIAEWSVIPQVPY